MSLAEVTLRAGVAAADITPPLGTSLSGFGYGRRSTGIRDGLQVRALALIDACGDAAVLVSTDLLAMTAEQIAALRREVAPIVAAERLLVSHSHTHSGPSIGLLRDTELAEPQYLAELVDSVASAVGDAITAAAPARLSLGTTACDLGVNRRLATRTGVRLAPNPGGPCDRDVSVLRIEALDGRPIACWFRLSAHPVTLGDTRISGDWPAEAARLLKGELGCQEALFAQGCCGDVNPVVRDSDDALRQIGRLAADAVVNAWNNARIVNPLESWGAALRVCDLPTQRPPGPDELAARMEVQVLRLADEVTLVGLSCEPFSQIATYVKEIPAMSTSIVIGYANGCFGYLPDTDAFVGVEGQRGYEVDQAPMWFRTPVLTVDAVDAVTASIAEAAQTAGAPTRGRGGE